MLSLLNFPPVDWGICTGEWSESMLGRDHLVVKNERKESAWASGWSLRWKPILCTIAAGPQKLALARADAGVCHLVDMLAADVLLSWWQGASSDEHQFIHNKSPHINALHLLTLLGAMPQQLQCDDSIDSHKDWYILYAIANSFCHSIEACALCTAWILSLPCRHVHIVSNQQLAV